MSWECYSYSDKALLGLYHAGSYLTTRLFNFVEQTAFILFGDNYGDWHVGLTAAVYLLMVAYVIEKRFARYITAAHKKYSIRSQVAAEKRKHYVRSPEALREDLAIWASTPSFQLYGLFLAFFIVAFALSHTCFIFPKWLIWHGEENGVQSLLTVLTGIGGVLFALIIFIAQLGKDGAGRYAVRVFLLRTRLLSLVALCLTAFFLVLGPSVNIAAVAIVFLLFLLTVDSVFWVIRLTLNQTEMQRSIDWFLRRELVVHVEAAISRRIGQNVLRSFLAEHGKVIQFLPWLLDRESYDHVSLPDSGVVTDINLALLKQAIELVRGKPLVGSSTASVDEADLQTPNDDESNSRPLAYLQKGLGDEIEGPSRALLSIKKGHVEGSVLAEIEGLIRDAFSVIRSDFNTSDELRNEFKELRQRFVSTLKDKPGSNIDSYVRTYTNLAEEFLKVLLRYPGRYDLKSARNEISNEFWGESWEEIGWLADDVKEIVTYALKNAETIQTEALLSTLYLPISICYRAVDNADNFLFQKFLPMLVTHCHYGERIKDLELRKLVLDRCVRYPKELADYYIFPKLKKKNLSQADRERLGDSVVFMLALYCGLTREAFLNGDVELVNKLIHEINNCGGDFAPASDRWNTEHLRWRLNVASSEEERRKLQDDLIEQEFLENLAERLDKQKRGILYGIATRLLDGVYQGGDTDWNGSLTIVLNFLPLEFEQLFHASRTANSIDSGGLCSFDRWQRELTEGVYWGGIDPNLAEILCLRLLITPEGYEFSVAAESVTNEMGYRCEPDGIITRALSDLVSRKDRLTGIVNEQQWAKVSQLRTLFSDIVKFQKQNEERTKRDSPLSATRVADFKTNAAKEFHESIVVRLILHHHLQCYVGRVDAYETENVITIGLNKIDDKAIFIEPWHVSYHGWGKAYGEGVASGEDSYLVHKLREFVTSEERGNFEKCLQAFPDAFLILVNVNSYLMFKDFSWQFTPEYQLTEKSPIRGFSGLLTVNERRIPVYSVHVNGEKPGILVLNRNLRLKIEQLAPFAPEKTSYSRHEELGIEITDLNLDEERRKEFVTRAPAWLTQVSTDANEQESYLRSRVQIMVVEKMRVTQLKSEEESILGYWIPTQDPDDF